MGLLDSLKGSGSKEEILSLRGELNTIKKKLKDAEAREDLNQQKYLELIDKTHAFMERLKILVGTLEGESVLEKCWNLLDLALNVKKGAIYAVAEEGWFPEFHKGFPENEIPVIPPEEDSMAGYAAENGLIMSLAYLRKQDDLAYLERRGVIPDAKIVCPVRVENKVTKLIIICAYSGNVFAGEDDLDTVQMVATILGLVLQNTKIIADHKSAIFAQRREIDRLRNMFSSMVAPEVIEFIEKNPSGIVLGGLRQPVAILFADIRGFTTIASEITPEKTIELLNKFFTVVTDIVIKTQGTLDKFMGDAAMALYGTPVGLDNPIRAALQAAIRIQKTLDMRMSQWEAEGFPRYGVGIGINFQEVVVGNVGSRRLSNFTAIGDGVNVASRLCSIAKAGEILVSESCAEQLSQWQGKINKISDVSIKGKAEPINVYSITEVLPGLGVCPQCGKDLPVKARFCGSCGYRQVKVVSEDEIQE